MCGKDGTQRGVYKLKEEHEKRGIGTKKEKGEKHKQKKKRAKVEKKNCIGH